MISDDEEIISIYAVAAMLGLRSLHPGVYEGVYATGEFDELFDYDDGVLRVHIGPTSLAKDVFGVMFSISSTDDGVWQAWDATPEGSGTYEEAVARSDAVATLFKQCIHGSRVLPTAKVLNDALVHLGLYGINTG